jgi:putative glutamine amidotransferase
VRSKRPLIGLPGRRKRIGQIDGFPESLHQLHVDVYFADYARSVYAAGGMPIHLPIDADPVDWVHHLDGLVLTGGADVEPARYGHENTDSDTEPRRDEIEFALLDAAVADGVPVLGICRGLQLLNVHAGGTLCQHRPEHARYDLDPTAIAHQVELSAGSVLGALYGEVAAVNSLHHQTVDSVGAGLKVAGVADDGTVEGIEVDGELVVAVQWHPEMMRRDDASFRWLVEHAAQRA